LKIGLLAERKGTRRRQQFLRAEGRKMSSEPLKRVTVRTLFGCRLGCGGLKQRRARDDTGVANEAGVSGDHVFDVPRRRVTELATSFGNEMLGQRCLPSRSPAADSQGEHLGYRHEMSPPTAAPGERAGCPRACSSADSRRFPCISGEWADSPVRLDARLALRSCEAAKEGRFSSPSEWRSPYSLCSCCFRDTSR
jgi:hypothetical protein